MLKHQIEFSEAVKAIYSPISGRASDPNSTKPEGNQAGIEACEQYQVAVKDLQATLAPELEMLESRIIAPAKELLIVVKGIQKLITKRHHKLLDYDRHHQTLKKLQEKKEKTLKDEKAIYAAENSVEQATQEYEYFNEMLKKELPVLFQLESEFIRPLFQNFYYMELNIFYTLNDKMSQLHIPYFDLEKGIEEAFHEKRGDVKEQAEALQIVHFKTSGSKSKSPLSWAKFSNVGSLRWSWPKQVWRFQVLGSQIDHDVFILSEAAECYWFSRRCQSTTAILAGPNHEWRI